MYEQVAFFKFSIFTFHAQKFRFRKIFTHLYYVFFIYPAIEEIIKTFAFDMNL